ncbi:MAG: hypothetical protein JWM80_987 [Cyanobacteria bacterium RYN_339]|nr:hypothetical protein [Cyanobacteria bacterium RYN_339]
MRLLLATVLAFTLLAAPAQAAQVVLKDGRVLTGAVKVEGAGLVLTGPDGKTQLVAFGLVQGISLDDQPVAPEPRPAAASKLFDNDWLVWTAIGANVATMVVGGIMLYRAATAK